jgi:hypothetical protein
MASSILFICKPVQPFFHIRELRDNAIRDPKVKKPEIKASHKVFCIDSGNVLHSLIFNACQVSQILQPGSQMDPEWCTQLENPIDCPYKTLILFMA